MLYLVPTLDEAFGLRALAALLDGDIDGVANLLADLPRLRLAIVSPSVSMHLAWRLALPYRMVLWSNLPVGKR